MTDISLSSIWTLTNGLAGYDVPTIALAKLLAKAGNMQETAITRKIVSLSAPYKFLAPYGPAQKQADCAPPYPDILIASGRHSVPLARHIRKTSGGTCFTVFLQNPRIASHHFDFVWAPAHDQLQGENVFSTLLSPHGLTGDNLRQAASDWTSTINCPEHQKRIGVLIGGPNKIYDYSAEDIETLVQSLQQLAAAGHYLMISLSRRTIDRVETMLRDALTDYQYYLWAPHHTGDNPYLAIHGLADAMLVTCDSVNMVGEACVTGAPVYIHKLSGGSKRFDRFHDSVCKTGHATFLDQTRLDELCASPFPPRHKTGLNSTPEIARKIIDTLRKRPKISL